uniref:Wax synthase domain-containing protein n=1 Tax=Populus trichocarpa TaxID=3694 RepID=B9HCG4_POPTR
MVTSILHPTVYNPIRGFHYQMIGTFLVSGLMHELIFYHIRLQKPLWEQHRLYVVGFVVATAMWLFMSTVVRWKIDVEARMEIDHFFH